MINIYIYSSILIVYLSICGFINKVGYKWYLGLIPIYNLIILFKILEIYPLILFIIGILLIVLEDRLFVFTTFIIFLPFILADAYNENILIGFAMLVFPIVFFPLVAFKTGIYAYHSGSLQYVNNSKIINDLLQIKYDDMGGD